MKHLIVVAHPLPSSFTMALAMAYAGELERLGHETRLRDLYRLSFEPVLSASELGPRGARGALHDDAAEEQAHIRWADALSVVYPLWWLSMPAILKGYVDRVFSDGFTHSLRDGAVTGLMSPKQAVLITLSNSSLSSLMGEGEWNAVEALQDGHVFRCVGFNVLEHMHLDEVKPNLAADVAAQYMTRVRACADWCFPAAKAPA
jgi:NAD(P)H dehydrogenase (quinone)